MAPIPNMEAFDATDRSAACVRRQRTNTPMAALVLMNDPQFLETARHLAIRVIKEGGSTPQERLDHLGQLLVARPYREDERAALLVAYEKYRVHFAANPTGAAAMLQVGDSAGDSAVPPMDQAVWLMMATTILNSDEFLNK